MWSLKDIFNNLGGVQNPAGHNPEHPAFADPALHCGAGLDDHQSCLPTSTVLHICQNNNQPYNQHDDCSI